MVKGSKFRAVPELIWDDKMQCYKVPLTKGQFALISKEDKGKIEGIRWYCLSSGYAKNDNVGSMHQVILPPEKGMHIDHKNLNKLDNRRENLRQCLLCQNRYNYAAHRNSASSMYKGVSWNKKRKRWVVYIAYKGRDYNLGRFQSEDDAARAYNKKAAELFGEFAYLNKIPDWAGVC